MLPTYMQRAACLRTGHPASKLYGKDARHKSHPCWWWQKNVHDTYLPTYVHSFCHCNPRLWQVQETRMGLLIGLATLCI